MTFTPWTEEEVKEMQRLRTEKVHWKDVSLVVGHPVPACRSKFYILQKCPWSKRADRKLYRLCEGVESPNWAEVSRLMKHKTADACQWRFAQLRDAPLPKPAKRTVWTESMEKHLMAVGPELAHQHNPNIKLRAFKDRYVRLMEIYH